MSTTAGNAASWVSATRGAGAGARATAAAPSDGALPDQAATLAQGAPADNGRDGDVAAGITTGAVVSLRPKTSQDVHIVPLSREVDRAVLPFVPRDGKAAILHAHKVILLVPETKQARRIALKVEAALRPLTTVERHNLASDAQHPTAGLQGLLQQVSWLCRRELEQGNRVHINLSSGSKLAAFAAGLVGMAHLRPGKGSVYYVQPDGLTLSEADFEEHGHTRGIIDVEELELLPVLLPNPLQLRVLAYLKHETDSRAEYRDLVRFLSQIPDSGYSLPAPGSGVGDKVRNWNNAVTTRMVRTIVSPLEEQGLVEIVDAGRQKSVRLTRRGRLYASIAGLEKTKLRAPLDHLAIA